MEKLKQILIIIFLLVVSLPAVQPLFGRGYFPMHDDTQPARVYEMAEALKEGQFPVRWVGNLGYGYGYPLFNFYAPLPYYFGASLTVAGVPIVEATKTMFGVGIVLSGISMYLLASKLWGKTGGLLAGVSYLYAPYHAAQIYVRGAVGEYWAYGLLPFVFYGLVPDVKNRRKAMLLSAFAFAGVVLSHNITALLLLGILVMLWFVQRMIDLVKQKQLSEDIFTIPQVLLLGLLLSAFFWLPALFEAHYTRVHTLIEGTNDFRQHFVYFDQLWDSPWGYAGSAPGRADGMSFMIGKLPLLLVFTAVSLVIVVKNNVYQQKNRYFFWINLIGFGTTIFMMLPYSVWVWEQLAFLKYVQYPWRFLVFANFFIALLIGQGAWLFERLAGHGAIRYFLFGVILLVLFYKSSSYFRPQFIVDVDEDNYISQEAMRWRISKISDEYLPKNFPIPQSPSHIAPKIRGDDIIVTDQIISPTLVKATISALHEAEIVFETAYFPGGNVAIDEKAVVPMIKEGLIATVIPKGKHTVTVYFKDTPIRRFGNWLSVLGIGVWLTLFIRQRQTII